MKKKIYLCKELYNTLTNFTNKIARGITNEKCKTRCIQKN